MQIIAYIFILISLLSFLWTGYQIFSTITISMLIVIVALFFIVILSFRKSITKYTFKVLTVALLINCWAFVVYLINANLDITRILLIFIGTSVALGIHLTIDKERQVKILLVVLIIGGTVSSIVAIGQVLIGGPFFTIWLKLHNVIREDIIYYTIKSRRPAGLSQFTIPFSYVLCVTLPIVLGVIIFFKRKVNFAKRYLLYLSFLTMAIALLLTQTRSAIAGGVIACLYLVFSNKSLKGKLMNLVIFIFVIIVMGYSVFGSSSIENDRLVDLSGASAQSRIPMLLTGFNYVIDHPLGTGEYKPKLEHIPDFVSNPIVLDNILNNTTHNQFANIMVYYGIPGLILLILFYFNLYKRYLLNKRYTLINKLTDLRNIQTILAGSFIGYTINSLSHNAGPFVGDISLWYIIGLFLVTDKLIRKPLKNTA